jgi:helix-turn-helix protein
MISNFGNLICSNDGTTKTISVVAFEDASGGNETITFQFAGQSKTVQVNMAANTSQVVRINHTASSGNQAILVQVSAANSQATLTQLLNLDKNPGDDGTGV